jgi:hypothetical protein
MLRDSVNEVDTLLRQERKASSQLWQESKKKLIQIKQMQKIIKLA